MTVRILNAALDQHEGHIVLRGALDPETMENLLTDDYQREVQPVTALGRIMKGFQSGSAVPDVELGMRGTKRSVREGIYTLHSDVYIIDGLQRVSAAKLFRANGGAPHLGATVHFGTDRDWERKLFKILNAERTRVSANIILRNFREDYAAMQSLYHMTIEERDFVLKGKICWQQRKSREHLLLATTFAKVIITLHSHLVQGCASPSADAEGICKRLQMVSDLVGRNILRANIRTLYETLDECFGLRRIAFAQKAPFIRATFLLTIARVLSNHELFWRDNRLLVEADLRKKLATFPSYDPTVVSISAQGSTVDRELYRMFVEHLNRGKRNRRLFERQVVTDQDEEKLLQVGAAEEADD